ncbi:MAG TPA: non-ribosomal peptide synthase/polyketide synthase [Polyangia bacterium]|nr:non-ribosomal peptide synthase/polyketide synthase [Polyangia bacterium]
MPGLRLEPLGFDGGIAKFDLTLFVQETARGLRLALEYNTDLFEAATIERMGGHFLTLLGGVVARPEDRLAALPLLTEAERHTLLVDWNQTRVDYPCELSVPALFQAQAARTPEAVALVFGERSLTYGELDRQANRLAHRLRALGVRAETPVALCVERSPELVVGLLGILKAGGFYVPLEVSYPAARIEAMIEDVGAEVLVTERNLLPALAGRFAASVCVDAPEQAPDTPLEIDTTGGDTAYVMFTSGSTGRPKGVLVPHRGIVRLVLGSRFARFGAGEVGLLLAPVAFDASTLELWGALLHGAKLVVAPPGALSLDELAGLLGREKVTTLWLTSALFEQMVLHHVEALATVSQVLTGGDVVPAARAQELCDRGGYVINGYGPTENTTFTTCHALPPGSQVGTSVPIGRPIANTRVYVLDEHLAPVPVGVPGELYAGGDGLAHGYVSRPELTAERFIPDPFGGAFGGEPGARLYRTGDRVRWRPEGTIEYLGRSDFQVKLRGFRIELGEIEAVLAEHPAVRQVAVVAREEAPGGKQLVAYVVPQEPAAPVPTEALRSFLQGRLPEYMVPSAVVLLPALPLTPNGKLDRRALPAPSEMTADGAARDHVAPRTPTEELLAGLWADVLRRPRVGVEDNFFELGGHSLLATQLVSRIRQAFRIELPVRALFEAPTVASLAERIKASLVPGGPAALRLQAPSAESAPHAGARPLSFAQQRMWFLDQFEPGNPFYNITSAVRLSGVLDAGALERSLQEVVRRHESLRTHFETRDGEPVQVIAPHLDLGLARVDLTNLPAEEREPRARELAREEALRPFDLGRGPLLRATLLGLGAEDHVLLITLHHIVSDGWSMMVLVRELGALYPGLSRGEPSPLPELPIQYADYAAWQRQWLTGEILERQLEHWRQRLGGPLPVLDLPTDHPRPPVQTYRGTQYVFHLPPELSQGLERASQQHGVTLFMTLLAAFQTLLYRYTGQKDIIIGAPIAGRTHAELEGLIGFFVNTLALRTDLGGNPTFRELLGQVREVTLGAYAHQDLPFEKLVEALQIERDMSRSPVFQVAFAFQNAPVTSIKLPGLRLEPLEFDGSTAKFDLMLFAQETTRGLLLALEYNTDLFEAATIERMAGHFLTLLGGVVARPEDRLAALPLLAEAERRTVLYDWNQTRVDYPRELSVPALFQAQAARTPEAVALAFGERSLTYGELDRQANRLAHRLRALGVRAETPVGLCVERSPELVVGLLGILKAGGFYVPLDVSYPAARIEAMIEDVGAEVLVTERKLLPALAGRFTVSLCVDAPDPGSEQASETPPEIDTNGGNTAYVMFTSGSTGRPKGVRVPHRGIVRLVLGSRFARFGAGEVWLLLAPVAFDASTLELWGALLHGAKLVVAPPGAMPLEDLGALVRREKITTLWLTTALFEQMVLHQVEALAAVPHVLTGGEVVPPARVQEVCDRGGSVTSAYGPTENTTFTTCHALPPGSQVGTTVPLGRPIANTRVYVLDEHIEPVPVGVAGELYTGGDGLAHGYVSRPELTAERFIPDPFAGDFGGEPGARLYRTGDRVRWRPDGTLEFVGRLDFQIKLRGFRIELGEIEAVLAEHPAVRQVVVVAREAASGGKQLVAYVVPQDAAATVVTDELRSFLQGRLPEYMVPSVFVVLPALPLTPTGKLDRRALPAPEMTAAVRTHVAPRTPAEELLADLWADVLRRPRVSVEDNFFELGGHSLLATQLVSRIRLAFRIELPVRALFEAPTVAALAQRIEGARQGSPGTEALPLGPVPRTGELPLSFAQQRLWFLDQFEPGNPFYNVPAAVRLTGRLDVPALARSLAEVVRRHEALRTHFELRDGEPVQVIAPHVDLRLDPIDLTTLPAERREARARELAREEALRPFDLGRGPLLRAALLGLGAEEHVLLITLHHIVSDGWSMTVLVRELGALYQAFSSGQPSPLPELPVQYADYAAWQRQWLQGEALERQLGYWKQHLGGRLPVLDLPTDHPRPPVQTYRGALHAFALSPALSQALGQLSRQHGVTLFMTLLGAFQTLLHRYTGQKDLIVGTPIAGRTRAEIEGLIGFFVNTLALRTELDGGLSFRELLARVREVTLGAYAHQDLPFEKLVEALAVERDMSRTPVFQVMFALQNVPATALELPGLTMRSLGFEGGIAKFDLTLSMQEGPDGLRGSFEYNTDLFEAGTIERLAGHFQTLLEGIAAAPAALERPLAELPLLREDERRTLLEEWNQAHAAYPLDTCVHDLFRAQATRDPDAPALRFGDEVLTYRELDLRSNQLACELQARGIGPERLVGLCLDRSPDLVVSLLAVLKAGGAYLPLDPAYPAERLAFMIEDARPALLVTERRLLESLPPGAGARIALDEHRDTVGRHDATAPAPVHGARPENLAYVIYTSGSTGRPKGAQLLHRGLTNTALTSARHQGLGPGRRVLQFAAFSFDASVFEIFSALVSGACVVLAPREELLPGTPLSETVRRHGVTSTLLPPSVLAQMDAEALPFETLVSGGEACSRELVERYGGRMRLLNAYGPTETTVCATISAPLRPGEEPVIGRPWDNARLLVLDARLEPVPVGVAGELYVGGAGLGRGYLGRAELTAERFVPDPFSDVPGARLYRTGDLVRWRSDGNLVYLGRTDHQVKLRGFRIELGEIEAALAEHPALRQAAVTVREDTPGGKRLVGYAVPKDAAPPVAELRDLLKRRLPDYMVPATFVFLEALPLTPSGKLDRRALPAPELDTAARASGAAPRTPAEELVAGMWAEVLGRPVASIGGDDNFFELGGHSLLATQVLSRIRNVFQVELPVRALFEAPTVATLAARIEAARQHLLAREAVPLQAGASTGELPLSFAQQRLWFLDQLEPGHAFYNLPVALRLTGALDVGALRRSLEEVVRRHDALRTHFESRDGTPVQIIAPHLEVALDPMDLTALSAEAREARARELVREEATRPFDLARGPLFRVALLRLVPDEHVLLVTLHHIVSDGWSMGILVCELVALYQAFCDGRPSPLPELPIQYTDHAAWQRQWLSGEVLEWQITYWKQQLRGPLPVLALPTDRPRPPVQTHRGAQHMCTLSPELVRGLEALSRQHGVTLFMTLLAAFQAVLHRYSGQTDIIVGTPIAGRTRAETEGLIGLFVNTLALRTDLEGRPTFRELLARVREVTLGAYAHQDLPFEKLVEVLEVERDLSRSPVFQVMFALQNLPPSGAGLPGLKLTAVPSDGGVAKFDLMLALQSDATGALNGALEYSTDLFEAATIERLAGHFQVLLAGIVDHPGADARIADLPLLGEAERRTLLEEWNAAPLAAPRGACLHTRFEAQAARTPRAIALVDGTRSLDYAELDQRANRLAHTLRDLGVRAETPVGICVERSWEMVVGLLGILKAGGVYVPLDPAYPEERLGFVIEDARVRFVVTQAHLVSRLPATLGDSARLLRIDADWDSTIGTARGDRPDIATAPEQLAYLIYTSGSTGRPKGVAIAHQNAVALLTWAEAVFAPAVLAGTLAATSIAFDLSIFELFLPLSVGGSVILARTALDLPELPARDRVTLVNTVPSALRELLRMGGLPAGVRVVNLAGEPLPTTLVQEIYGQPGIERVYDLYGPSETTTYSTWALRRPDGPATIGRPIAGTRVYVLDAQGQPVPAGVPGELYIGGAGVARGYLGRPELTADRFVPDPFAGSAGGPSGGEPGARLYRTGDLVRWRLDGTLEYLGRTDFQVKVRGFRIELGEVEAVLLQHPSLRQAVVVAREDRPGDKRLVAYLVAREAAATVPIGELREFLKRRLPEYMVPTAFVFLGELPLTSNGKLDRRALPAPDATSAGASAHVDRAPRTPTEELVAGLWAGILGRPPASVGVEDNFFELGGHSLLATQVLSRIRNLFQVELPVRMLFEAPTVAALAQRIDEARAARREVVALAAPPLRPVPRTEPLPLSFAQQRLWFLDQLEPGSPFYNIPVAVRLTGALDGDALERSFAALVRRHEALRTHFELRDGQPVQAVAPELELGLTRIDLQALPAEEREARARSLAREEALRPFDLGRGPLLRVQLLRLGPEDHLLLVTLHHIISDGWSMGILVRELGALYQHFSEGRPAQTSPLPELPIQYADHAAWQRQWLQGEVLERQLSYWKQQLGGRLPVLDLPTDHPRPPIQTYRGGLHHFTLAPALTQALAALGREQGATLFMTLLAAFQALLYRYTGQKDLVVGTPIAGRTRIETEGLIGCFINTLALRTDLDGQPTFRELLGRVREVTLGAYAHQDVPFEKLVEVLGVERDLSRSPVFQVMFALQNLPLSEAGLPGLKLTPLPYDGGIAKFDLSLTLQPGGEGLLGGFEYNTDLFEAATIERLAGHFQVLLAGIVGHPAAKAGAEVRITELPLLTAAERRTLLEEWAAWPKWTEWAEWEEVPGGPASDAAPHPVTQGACLHTRFEAQVARTPRAIALVDGTRSLDYAELDERANRLAHTLRDLGVRPETPVGICIERSWEMVVGLLGILKAGGVYVPLDPAYPEERLGFVIDDARVRFVVTQAHLVSRLPATLGDGARILRIDTDWDTTIGTARGDRPGIVTAPEQLAYLIYTSGSTGRPKGVAIAHQNAVALLTWAEEVFEPEVLAGTLASTSIAFDLSIFELFLSLSVGGSVILARTVLDLPELPARDRVTLVNTVPSAVRELLRMGGLPAGVRVVNLAGEPLPTALVREIYARPGIERVYDLYGPSETTTYSTWALRRPDGPATIGRPIAGTRVYVLDAQGQPVPAGVPGELYIGGAGVARGYLGRPELTADRFVPDPFGGSVGGSSGSEPGARLYRTGDLVRWRSDGTLEYLGRTDFQVKVRGFRIELGEVETALLQHPSLRQAVVLVREDAPGDKRLVAYLVAQEAAVPSGELRAFLQRRLPEYMVPSAFVFLEALPLTPNGKLDRRALPSPDQGGVEAREALLGPRDELEAKLVHLWEEVLGVRPVGVRQHFFELGGHSLLAARLVAEVRKVLGRPLPLLTLFQNPTIEQLARALRQKEERAASGSALVQLQAGQAGERPLFLVHGGGGSASGYAELARHLDPARPVYAFHAPGLDGGEMLPASVEAMARHYVGLMRGVQAEGPYLLGGWSFGGVVAFEMARQLEAVGGVVELLALIDSHAPSPEARLAPDELALLAGFGRILDLPVQRMGLDPERLRALGGRERLAYVLEQARRTLGDAFSLELDQVERYFAIFRHHEEALRRYVPRLYTGRMVLLRAGTQEVPGVAADLGWGAWTTGGLIVDEVPGEHYTLLSVPQVAPLAAKLGRHLKAPDLKAP